MDECCTTCGQPIDDELMTRLKRESSRRKGERIRETLLQKKLRGERLGRPKLRDDMAILKLRGNGMSIAKIAAALGISRGSVLACMRQTGEKNG